MFFENNYEALKLIDLQKYHADISAQVLRRRLAKTESQWRVRLQKIFAAIKQEFPLRCEAEVRIEQMNKMHFIEISHFRIADRISPTQKHKNMA